MEAQTSPSRNVSPAGSAATIVALLSMATMVSALPAARTPAPESRSASTEAASVREIAVAVVAAAARDLLGRDRLDTAVSAPMALMAVELRGPRRADQNGDDVAPGIRVLPERLLDLPPPAC
jgi:hypothetical protein